MHRLALLLACAMCFAYASSQQTSQDVVPIRSIDPSGTDYSDLQPLKRAIGNSRIVVLAEQDHGDGSTLLAKSRLVKFFHQEMGFDVLAFESDYYSLDRMQRRKSPDYIREAQSAIAPYWSRTQEMSALWQYLHATQATSKPMDIAGFNINLNTDYAKKTIMPEFEEMLRSEKISFPENGSYEKLETILDSLVHGTPGRGINRELAGFFFSGLDSIQMQFQPSSNQYHQHVQLLQSFRYKAEHVFLRNYRERNMAANLAHLVSRKYPNRKIIVWTASYHAIKNMQALTENNPAQASRYANAQDKDTVNTMIEILRHKHGISAFVINMVALSGSFTPTSWISTANPPAQITHQKNSVEDQIHQQQQMYAFVALNHLPADHWLRQPREMIPFLHQTSYKTVWPTVFDALFFIKEMKPLMPISN